MTRGIREGDEVRIYMAGESPMRKVTGAGLWTVTWTPCDVGDSWHFKQGDWAITLNPNSANFDGLELIERKEATS